MTNKLKQNINDEKNKLQTFRIDWFLLIIFGFLLLGGLTFLASSLSFRSIVDYQSEFFKQLFFGLWIGGFLTYFLAKTDYHNLLKFAKPLLWISITSLLFLVVFIIYMIFTGKSDIAQQQDFVNSLNFLPIKPSFAGGAVRWIKIGFGENGITSIQPSEIIKLTMLLYFATSLQNIISNSSKITWFSLKKPLYMLFVVLSLIYLQRDLGNPIIIFGICFAAMWMVKVPFKILGILLSIGLVFGYLAIIGAGYRSNRVQTFLDISKDSSSACNSTDTIIRDRNRQVCGVRASLTRGGMWGKGYGSGTGKQDGSVPEVSNDGILAVIGEEVGFVGTIIFLSLYIILFYKSLRIAKNAPDIAGTALAGGIGFWITSQAFLNVAGITGLLPLKGIPLPFVSEGGSALVLNMMAVGILFNISSQKKSEKLKNNSNLFDKS